MEIHEPFSDLEKQISDMLDQLNKQEPLSAADCKQVVAGLEKIKEYQTNQSSKSKKEKMPTMDAKIDDLIRGFHETADDSKQQLQSILALISEGRVPDAPAMSQINATVDKLREQYTDVCQAAAHSIPAEEMPQEGSSADAYVEAVKNSKFLEYRKQLDEMRRTLEKFVSVQSRVQIFADALASYQKKAQELMQSIDTLSPVQEETVTSFKEKTAGPAAFLSALECTNLYTDKGMALLKDIAENYYTQNISYGLSGHQYFLPKPAEAIPAPKELAPVAVPVANAVETEEAMTTAASDVSAPEAVAETAIPETVSAPFGNDTDNSEAERWRKLGIDDPQAYLYPVSDDLLNVERSKKAELAFSTKKFDSDIHRHGDFRDNKNILILAWKMNCVNPEMLLKISGKSSNFIAPCEQLLNLGYLQKYIVKGYPCFYTLTDRGNQIFTTQKSAELLGQKKATRVQGDKIEDTVSSALTRVLYVQAFELGILMGDINFDSRENVSTDSFYLHLRYPENDIGCSFAGIIGKTIESFESVRKDLFWDDSPEAFEDDVAFIVLGMNKEHAHRMAEFFDKNIHDAMSGTMLCYYDYETKTCYRYADDAVVSLAELIADDDGEDELPVAEQAGKDKQTENVLEPVQQVNNEETLDNVSDESATEEPENNEILKVPVEETMEQSTPEDENRMENVPEEVLPSKDTIVEDELNMEAPEKDAPSENIQEEPAAPVENAVRIDIQGQTVRENAELLLKQPEKIGLGQLMEMTVQLISENRIAEAVSLAESLAESPTFSAKTKGFYHAFRQSVRQPGQNYKYSSAVINNQQEQLISEANDDNGQALQTLRQTIILANTLWAMAFPSEAYDHNLYNGADTVLTGELRDALPDETAEIEHLMKLLQTDLKDLSFQYDGLGFSPVVIRNLVNNGELEKMRAALRSNAKTMQKTPTSTVQITGLEDCLKRIVGPKSEIGQALQLIAEGHCEKAAEIRSRLEKNLGLKNLEVTDAWLENYIDSCWTALRNEDRTIKVKHLDNDSAAQKVCKKALTERLHLIADWLNIVENNQNSEFLKFRDQYARLWNQLKKSLIALNKVLSKAPAQNRYLAACQNILKLTSDNMEQKLEGYSAEEELQFYRNLWTMPELIIGMSGENLIVPELYDVSGLEPWVILLRGMATPAEEETDILRQIGDFRSERWYRNYGIEDLIHRVSGQSFMDHADISRAEETMKREVEEFEGFIRMEHACGKLQGSMMETASLTMNAVKNVYQKTCNFASFHIFLGLLRQVLDKAIERQLDLYRARVKSLEQQEYYAGNAMLELIHKALSSGNLINVDTYINCMQNGETELPTSIRNRAEKKNFLAEFQSGEDFYCGICQNHRSDALYKWAGRALEQMDKAYQHWSSPNELAAGKNWVKNWIPSKDASVNLDCVKGLLLGLGFDVVHIKKSSINHKQIECYEVAVKPSSTNLTDYPHPVYKFGTEISDPLNVVCLYGCQGVNTLIKVMTKDLHLSGSTIVFMDGSLTSSDRRQMAENFKADTSRQSPFLLIDRVLAMYLASVDKGDRQNAMLCCTLPYTFEVLYGNGTGTVPEEMFIGRMMELHDLRNKQGSNLVYGGRQLGKTALLNRASKTLNIPEKREYSFCVEVKDSGSKLLLERVNKQLQRLGLIQDKCSSLQELCETLQDIYEEQKISMLRIFVDEVDCLFEEFQKDDYRSLRPFIELRDATKNNVKFVFAGTHNVAAMDIAEEENNNLIHMGKPLCIKPLSVGDAMDLIRIPMSYLGFEIGEPQIELILSNTNSYPGLIHMFCSALIHSVCRDYQTNDNNSCPPYHISEAQMQTVFQEQDIRKELGTRVMATILLNRKYKVVSYLLAEMIYEDRNRGGSSLRCYDAQDLKECNEKDYGIPLIQEMKEKDLNVLMNEMENMGILWKDHNTQKFRFRQQDFLGYIGDSDKLLKYLLYNNWEDAE